MAMQRHAIFRETTLQAGKNVVNELLYQHDALTSHWPLFYKLIPVRDYLFPLLLLPVSEDLPLLTGLHSYHIFTYSQISHDSCSLESLINQGPFHSKKRLFPQALNIRVNTVGQTPYRRPETVTGPKDSGTFTS